MNKDMSYDQFKLSKKFEGKNAEHFVAVLADILDDYKACQADRKRLEWVMENTDWSLYGLQDDIRKAIDAAMNEAEGDTECG